MLFLAIIQLFKHNTFYNERINMLKTILKHIYQSFEKDNNNFGEGMFNLQIFLYFSILT